MTYADLSTVEGLNEAAHKYYDWTDAQTAVPNDGKALYGRDALTTTCSAAHRNWVRPSLMPRTA